MVSVAAAHNFVKKSLAAPPGDQISEHILNASVLSREQKQLIHAMCSTVITAKTYDAGLLEIGPN